MNKNHFFDNIDKLIEESKQKEKDQASLIYGRKIALYELIKKLEPVISLFNRELIKRSANFSFKNTDNSVEFTITDSNGVTRFLLLDADSNQLPRLKSSPISGITDHRIYTNTNPFDDVSTFTNLMEKLIIQNYKFRPKISE